MTGGTAERDARDYAPTTETVGLLPFHGRATIRNPIELAREYGILGV